MQKEIIGKINKDMTKIGKRIMCRFVDIEGMRVLAREPIDDKLENNKLISKIHQVI